MREDDEPEEDSSYVIDLPHLVDLPAPVASSTDLATDTTVGPDVPEPVPGSTYEPARAREMVRTALAIALVVVLASLVLLPLVGLMFLDTDYEKLRDFYATVFPTVSGLVGGAVGFYFGSRQK